MPINIHDKTYALPGEDGLDDISGTELDAIEAKFAVDALTLLSMSGEPSDGYTKSRWLYANAWLGLKRTGDSRTLAEIMDLPITAITFPKDAENPTDATSSVAE